MLDLKTLIPRLRERAELRVFRPSFDMTLELVALDKDGKVTARRRFRSHSFLQNFIDLQMYGLLKPNAAGTALGVTGRDINGTFRSLNRASAAGGAAGPAPIGTSGTYIVVGTGTTAVANADFQLVGQAGQVAASFGDPSTTSLTRSFTVSGSVSLSTQTTINEVGLKCPFVFDTTGSGSAGTALNVFLLVRDIVAGGFVVSAGGSIVVTYTISAAS
jgi:hypothetical protein